MMKLKVILAYVLLSESFVLSRFTSFCKLRVVSLLGNYLHVNVNEGSFLNWVAETFAKSKANKFISFVMSPVIVFKDLVIFFSASIVLDNFESSASLKFPVVECSIFGKSFAALLDTGANWNIGTKKLYIFCMDKVSLTRRRVDFSFANDVENAKTYCLQCNLPVIIENRCFVAPFFLFTRWKSRIMLGRDFLRRSEIILNIYDNVWYFQNSSRRHQFISEKIALAIQNKSTSSSKLLKDKLPTAVEFLNVLGIELDFQIFGTDHRILIDSGSGFNYGSQQLYDLCKEFDIKMEEVKEWTTKHILPNGDVMKGIYQKACIPLQLNDHTYYTTFKIFKDNAVSQTKLGLPFLMRAPIILDV